MPPLLYFHLQFLKRQQHLLILTIPAVNVLYKELECRSGWFYPVHRGLWLLERLVWLGLEVRWEGVLLVEVLAQVFPFVSDHHGHPLFV